MKSISGGAQGTMQTIKDQNERMIELVNSLLDVSRLDLGKLINNPEATNIAQLAQSVEKELSTSIAKKHIAFDKKIASNLATVYADPKLLRIILQNLLSNAVKYTPEEGAVMLTLRQATSEEVTAEHVTSPGPHFYLSVTDNGFGIPAAQQNKIFQKMFRADNVLKMDMEGTGLGLYIVREVTLMLGGNIRFTSVEGKGTTLYVILPFTTKASSLPSDPVIK